MPPFADPVVAAGGLARLPQPTLDLGDLHLRPWSPTDAPAVVDAYAEPSIQRWHVRSMTGDEAGAWVHAWRDRWQEESGASWAVAGAGVVLGQVGLRRVDLAGGLAKISYWVLPAARGAGVATGALRTLSGWAFGELGLHRLEVTHSTRNPPSCRVAEKAGYVLEGTKRREGLHADGWHDMHLHARLADDGPS